MAAPKFITPNLYQLHGNDIHITYSTTGLNGQPHFSYQDEHQNLNFTGSEIRQTESELGIQVSVFLRRTIDSGSTSFSVLIPRINLRGQENLPITTFGIKSIHRFSIIPALDHGQLDTYKVINLKGTAANVAF